MTYNARLQVESFELRQANNFLAVSSSYQYYADGQLKFSHSIDEHFDRAYSYDHAARATEAYSGSEARDYVNGTQSGTPTGPYRQSYQYNALSEVSQQTNRLWSQTRTTVNTFVNNRLQGWSYDADGELTHDDTTTYTRDASNRIVAAAGGGSSSAVKYDGDGLMVWRQLSVPSNPPSTQTNYYLNSSILGLAVAELNANGQKTTGHVYAGGRKIADAGVGYVAWSHTEPVTGSNGQSYENGYYAPTAEFNADGVDVGFFEPASVGDDIADPYSHKGGLGWSYGCSSGDCVTCFLDGFEHDCTQMGYLFDIGVAGQCPDNNCGPRSNPNRDGPGRRGWEILWLFQEGFSYQPLGPSSRPPGSKPPKLKPRPATPSTPPGGTDEGPDPFGDSIIPQNPSTIPLDINRIAKLLDNPTCNDFVTNLINKAAELYPNNPANSGSALDLVNAIKNGKGGYFLGTFSFNG